MRRKLLLLALCLCALGVMLGQNEPALVGMPELGVTLTGSAEHPEIVSQADLWPAVWPYADTSTNPIQLRQGLCR